ncbi:MAG: hypothetical protein H0W09_02020 [Solirubrobacterales bacterium]|nr:hypothetical protein [Solirubrobacterales bacterium]
MSGGGLVGALSGVPWRRARNVAAGLDLTRSTGARYAWQRWEEERRWKGAIVEARNSAYAGIWGEAAEQLGSGFRALGDGLFEFGDGSDLVLVRRGHAAIDSRAALDAAFDKPKHHALLGREGIPVPDHLEFAAQNADQAIGFLERAGSAVVVKPAAGTGAGSGVTSGITTAPELRRAVLRASRSASRLQVERQADGEEYRVLLLDGEVIDVVRRHRPRVRGDGRSTIAELVGAENHRRLAADGLERLRWLKVDLDCVLTLQRQGLRLSSVPARDTSVVLKQVVNQNAAAENETVHESLADELVAEVVAAARTVGIRLAGVDIVTSELGSSLARAGGVVLEVNADPGIHHHYAVADRSGATRVAVPILRTILREHARGKETIAR